MATLISPMARRPSPDTPPGSGRTNEREGPAMSTLPITRDLTMAHTASFIAAILIAIVSAVGLGFGSAGLYGVDPQAAIGITASTAGVLVPGFRAHDGFNL